jgi:hypothetical protein
MNVSNKHRLEGKKKMVAAAPHLFFRERVNRYRVHMTHAALREPANPISSHSLERFYLKQQEWTVKTSAILSLTFEQARSLAKAADTFDTSRKSSAFSSFSMPDAAPVQERVLRSVRDLLAQFNRYQGFLHEHAEMLAPFVALSGRRMLEGLNSQLARIGIRQAEDGSLVLDEERLASMLETDFPTVKRTLAGPDGFAARVRREAKQVTSRPLGDYSPVLGPGGRSNPYAASLLSSLFFQQAAYSGIFFNQTF